MRIKFTFTLIFGILLFNIYNSYAFADVYDMQVVQTTQQVQTRLVTGKVIDISGKPIAGVNVSIKGSNRGASTNAQGEYELRYTATPGAVMVFSFVGMKHKQVILTTQVTINVTLEPDTIVLEDIIVQGAYGTAQKRSDLVGSAFQITSNQLKNLPTTRVDEMLDGLIPGFTISPNSDSPSSRPRYNLRIRGEASLSASNEPLWVVDGTPIYTGDRTNQVPGMSATVSPLSFMNPDDIESITVLKDATSTSIYGANGANGVILVTTKRGSSGNRSINFSARYGVSHIMQSTKFKVLNAEQYWTLLNESYSNVGGNPAIFPYQDNDVNQYSTTDTDWSKVYYGMGHNMQGNISLQGGNEKSTYYISGGYFRSEATVKGNSQERYSVRSNLNVKLTNKLSATFNLSATYNINQLFTPYHAYYKNLPIFSVYDDNSDEFRLWNKYIEGWGDNGSIKWKETKFLNNYVNEREQNDNRQRAFTSNDNVILNYDIIKGLSLTAQLGVDYQSNYEDTYNARKNWSGYMDGEFTGYSLRGNANFLTWTNIERLNYTTTIRKHTINGLLGFEMTSTERNTVATKGSGFVNDFIKEISYAANRSYGESSAKTDRSMSFFAQGGYNFDKRYYLSVSFRKEGNSSFGKDVRWANFASVGVSWNIHNEAFFESDVIDILKLKTSYGTNGNSRLGSIESQGTYSYGQNSQYIGQAGGLMSASANPRLSWETTKMTNIGARISMFKRLDVEIEYYSNKTVDLLSQLDVSRTTGDTRVYRNVGKVRNRGFEMTITSDNISTETFNWRTELNASHNKNTLLELYNGNQKVMSETILKEGYDTKTYYLIRWAGVDPRDGYPLWYDANGNITRVYSPENRVPYKSAAPLVTGGMTNTFSYKNLSLRVMLKFSIGGYGFSSFSRNVSSDGLNILTDNQSVNQLDRWRNPGDLALGTIQLYGVSTKSVMSSTRHLYNKTNLQLQNIALTYDIPKRVTKRLGLNAGTITAIADNLSVWTPYDHKDRNSYRQSMSGYPMERTYTLSLGLSF